MTMQLSSLQMPKYLALTCCFLNFRPIKKTKLPLVSVLMIKSKITKLLHSVRYQAEIDSFKSIDLSWCCEILEVGPFSGSVSAGVIHSYFISKTTYCSVR